MCICGMLVLTALPTPEVVVQPMVLCIIESTAFSIGIRAHFFVLCMVAKQSCQLVDVYADPAKQKV